MVVPTNLLLLTLFLLASVVVVSSTTEIPSQETVASYYTQQKKIGNKLLKVVTQIIDKGNASEINTIFSSDATVYLPISPKTAVGIDEISEEYLNLRFLLVSAENLNVSYIYVNSSRFFIQVHQKVIVITPIGTFKNFTRDYIADVLLTGPAVQNPLPRIRSLTEYSEFTHIFVARGLCSIPDTHYDTKVLLCPSPFPHNATEQASPFPRPLPPSSTPPPHDVVHPTHTQPIITPHTHNQPPHQTNSPSTPNTTPHSKPNTPPTLAHPSSSSSSLSPSTPEEFNENNEQSNGKKKKKGFRRRQRYGGPRANFVTW